ncbi:MAG: chemotaxis protein CheB [Candidatus Eremiobacteraeota bacterium]|nr:chemotaxis protein CheB [Candidatus Eremiobacteraeota bacterium]
MSGVPVVAVGTSAGGIEALHALLPRLRPEWNLAFAIVIHRQAVEDDARLESLLNSWAGITVLKARNGEPIVPGRAVVCPADVHLIVDDSHFRLTTGPRENHSRPSVDVLFRSVAQTLGELGAGIILSGTLDDGAAGIRMIRERGGLTIAQDPEEALHSGMPRSAIAAGAENVLRISDMDELLEGFGTLERPATRALVTSENGARLTRFTCPDCNGVLVEQHDGNFVYYKCRVGHTFSAETLHAQKSAEIENALWSAIQVLEEQIDLTERVIRRARNHGNERLAQRMETRAERYRERVEMVKLGLPSVEDAIETSEARDQMA